MQNNHFCETENIKHLAGFDFLDVCLLGETGTGKTHTARLIHEMSPRSKEPFVAVNCAELAPSIIESELFGYEKGAFTGAVANKAGKFEAATGGTLFLDEIGELSANLQAKLLKVTEEKCITRVGGNRPRPVDVRIIYATHRNLDILREDLRYRIAAHAIYLKPLRERQDEIVSLARLFVTQFSHRSRRVVNASDDTLKLLETARWQGNIRELQSFIEKACLNALFSSKSDANSANTVELTKELILSRLSAALVKPSNKNNSSNLENLGAFAPGENMESYLRRIETYLLKNALDNHNNNQTRAAKELGISRTGLIKKMKRIGH
ncbi:MAG TPA: sigma 54-interacting transcriptional regulator [Pyrinomonadaceae bacterium]|nr:sigma 54-interacting transcriptional regulator [Pyrinomonadaceae bacterium]